MARRLVKRVALLLAASALTLLGVRAYDSQRGPELERWHTYRPHELNATTRNWQNPIASC